MNEIETVPGTSADSTEDARGRLAQVFEYLKALHEHRNPAVRRVRDYGWTLALRDLPAHESILRGWLEGEAPYDVPGAVEPDGEEASDAFILRVKRPALSSAPARPAELSGWIEGDWRDPDASLTLGALEPLPLAPEAATDDEAALRLERVRKREAEHRERGQHFARWLGDVWKPWAEAERPARQAMRIFDSLYDLYGRLQREAERVEIVVGDGMLVWRQPAGGIHHPLLLQRLQLQFDPDVPQFTLTETDQPAEFYAALGQAVPNLDSGVLIECREELERSPVHPLAGRAVDEYLRRVVNRLSPSEGAFLGEGRITAETDAPRIARDPYVFLRSRAQGYGLAIERVLEDLRASAELPHPILGAVGIEAPQPPPGNGGDGGGGSGGAGEEESANVLLSKSANAEQVRIAERLEAQWSVLVQGPPGTGKTHTIANLLGHLLAQGKSVLVTSHTTKALRVLRHQVVEALQPLCVSVLDSDAASRQELEDSVRTIVERLGTSGADQMREEGERLAQERLQILNELRGTRAALIEARSDEYRAIVIDGGEHQPSAAARLVRAEAEAHGWIPAPVTLGAPLPLSNDEIAELYRTNRSVTPADEAELGFELPDPESLPVPIDFERLLEEISALEATDLALRSELWEASATTDLARVQPLHERLRQAVGGLDTAEEWKLEVIAAGASKQPADRASWEELVREIEALVASAAAARELIFRHGPALATDEPLEEQLRTFAEIRTHMQAGGSLGGVSLLFRPGWKRVIQASSVFGQRPSEVEHFEALEQLATLTRKRNRLRARWDLQMTPLGAPAGVDLGEEVERVAERFISSIRRSLGWRATEWAPIEAELVELGFRWSALLAEQPPRLDRHGDVLRLRDAVHAWLPAILTSRIAALLHDQLVQRLHDVRRELDRFQPSEVVDRLRTAVGAPNPVDYANSYARLVELRSRSSDLRRRRELIGRLAPVAQGWADALQQRAAPHDSGSAPGDARRGWLWRQLHDELERRGRVSLETLQTKRTLASARLRTVTAQLIDRRAWEAQVRRTTLRQQQALMGYRGVVRKIGKGTGLRAPRLKQEAQRLMAECRGAVPVWIMPLARVADTFDPRTTRFDVVIIDEASQCDMLGLIAVYLGRKVIVVGDDEQVSPDAVGQRVEEVERLISVHLKGVPNSMLYDGQRSIYDLANESFGSPIRLVEHFRCVPEIIQFSNHLSYGGTIRPLRDASGIKLLPHTVAHRVDGAFMDGRTKTNREEAEAIVSLVAASIEQPEYADKTFGVISMLGDQQALLVEQLLHSALTPQQYAHHRLLCGNASQFQGDERDVMFLSLVHGPPDQGLLRIVNEGPLDATKKRYNVAASRARDQMWVVHSMDPGVHLKPEDLRLRLIEHARNPVGADVRIGYGAAQAESPFEEEVQRILIPAGYDVVPQWRVGGYRIDMVVQGNGRRLAIECDGDRFHPPEQLEQDMARQALLERLGWTFVRIRGSRFFRTPDEAMEPVFARLREMGIDPSFSAGESGSQAPVSDLLERVRRRAAALRREWTAGSDVDAERVGPPSAAVGDEPEFSELSATAPALEPSDETAAEGDESSTRPNGVPQRSLAGDPASEVRLTLAPYVQAACPFGEPAPERLQSDMDVLRTLFHVAQAEAPVHVEVVIRQTSGFFGAQRVSRQLRERLMAGLTRLERAGRIVVRNGFVWLPEQDPSTIAARGVSPDGYARAIETVPTEEIGAAARLARTQEPGLSANDLIASLVHAFGFAETGTSGHSALATVLAERVDEARG